MTYEALLDIRVEISKLQKNSSMPITGKTFIVTAAKERFKTAVRQSKRFGEIDDRQKKMLFLNL